MLTITNNVTPIEITIETKSYVKCLEWPISPPKWIVIVCLIVVHRFNTDHLLVVCLWACLCTVELHLLLTKPMQAAPNAPGGWNWVTGSEPVQCTDSQLPGKIQDGVFAEICQSYKIKPIYLFKLWRTVRTLQCQIANTFGTIPYRWYC